jgi:predicted GTPase
MGVATIGHDLTPRTIKVRRYVAKHPSDDSCKVFLVDTPGFDDPDRTDAEILGLIAEWLTNKLVMILYLYCCKADRNSKLSTQNKACRHHLPLRHQPSSECPNSNA